MGIMGQNTAVIYARVSTSDQDCDRQVRDLISYADRSGYNVIGIYKEIGSGTYCDRKQRSVIARLARARKINAVLCTELSRWGRSLPDIISTLTELDRYGCSLICQSGLQLDLKTPHGKMIAGVLSSLAEFERDLLIERIRSGLDHARSKGKTLGRPRKSKIYNLRNQIIDDRQNGKTIRAIASSLNISKSSVDRIIRSDRNLDLPEGLDF
jgi:DNA invertase Pin-like site-specific DNA recombinase